MADEVVQPSTAERPTGDPGPVAVVPASGSALPADTGKDAKTEDQKGDSLDRALRAAAKEIEAKNAAKVAPVNKDPKAADAGAEGKDTKPADDGKPKPDGESPLAEDDAAKAPALAAKPGLKPKDNQAPNSWSAPAKAKFSGLDPVIRNEILKRDRETVAGVEKLQTELRAIKPAYEDFDRAIGPYKDMFARRGITPGQAVSQLLALSTHAENNFLEFVKEQAALRGVDLLQALQTAPGGGEPPKVDPEVAALRQKLSGIESHLHSQRTAAEQQKIEAGQRQQREIAAQVESFENDVDGQGNLKHPHFALVKAHMGGLMQADMALDLERAYEQACWAHPEIREELQIKATAGQEAARKAEAERAANAAKSAIRGAPPNGSTGARPPVDPKDLEATLRHFTAKAMGEGVRL